MSPRLSLILGVVGLSGFDGAVMKRCKVAACLDFGWGGCMGGLGCLTGFCRGFVRADLICVVSRGQLRQSSAVISVGSFRLSLPPTAYAYSLRIAYLL
jgi:hypothetical protein